MWIDIKPTDDPRYPWRDSTGWPSNYARTYRWAWYVGDTYRHVGHGDIASFKPKARTFSPSITRICWADSGTSTEPPK